MTLFRREFHDDPTVEVVDTHLFSADVRSIADVSAQKREGGRIIKGMIKKEITHLGGHMSPDETDPMINYH
jgi:hypothetical protein